ncbi:MAG: hypothetical protein KC416_05245 [Myxococcales bacterium]|nr:hypothetical protein [Myxococcales bacterium]
MKHPRNGIVLTVLCTLVHLTSPGNVDAQAVAKGYQDKLAEGIAHRDAGRLDRAAAAFSDAIALDASLLQAHYDLAEVRRMAGDFKGAFEALTELERRAKVQGDAWMEGRALIGMAVTHERTRDIGRAREMWLKVLAFADGHGDTAVDPKVARARIQVIDELLEREQVYIAVRERIAERQRKNQEASP